MLPILSIAETIVEANSPPTNISNMSVNEFLISTNEFFASLTKCTKHEYSMKKAYTRL